MKDFKMINKKVRMSDLRQANPIWFAPGKKKYHGDINYRILTGKKTKNKFLCIYTIGFSNIFGNTQAFYHLKPINSDLTFGHYSENTEFKTLEEVKEYLKEY
jgi:hypothetical protein